MAVTDTTVYSFVNGMIPGDGLPGVEVNNISNSLETFLTQLGELFGQGCWLSTDFNLTAGAGLSVDVSVGTGFVGDSDGIKLVQVTSVANVAALTDATTNYIYLQRAGTYTSNTTGTAPANSIKVGSCVTAAGAVSSVNSNPSGRVNFGLAVTNAGTQTLTNKTLTSPKVGTSILDTNGNELFLLTATGSAVNELTLANAAASGRPVLSATGNDTNISWELQAKGTGQVVVASNVASANVLGGVPVVHRYTVAAGATGDLDVTLTHKTLIYDVCLYKKVTVGGGDGTIQVKNTAAAITNAMSINVADETIVRATTINDANNEIAAGGILRITRTRTTSLDESCEVVVSGFRIA